MDSFFGSSDLAVTKRTREGYSERYPYTYPANAAMLTRIAHQMNLNMDMNSSSEVGFSALMITYPRDVDKHARVLKIGLEREVSGSSA